MLAGVQLAVLGLFLNPHLPRDLGTLAGGAVRGALLFAPLSLAAHGLLAWRRGLRVARILPWSVTAVMIVAALGDWVHASRYSFYLAPGLGANLIKLALWLTLAAIVCFYTALLHTVHHRRYGARSVALVVFMGLGSVYVARARLVSHRPSPPAAAPAAIRALPATPHTAIVLVDGATLDVFLPLARQSRLPFFSRLFELGASARLRPVTPVIPLAAQGSLASGKLPYRHALVSEVFLRSFWLPGSPLRLVPLGFETLALARPDREPEPFARSATRARAFWEIAAAAGSRVAAIGLPPVLASDGALAFAASSGRFARPAAAAIPDGFDARIQLLEGAADRSRPSALAGLEPATADRVGRALAGDSWRAAVAESLLEGSDEVDLLVLALPGFAGVALEHRAGFDAAEFEGTRNRADRDSAAALTIYAAELDSALERLWERLDSPRLLVVASPFGVDRPRGLARAARELLRTSRTHGTLAGEPDGALWLLAEGLVLPGATVGTARTIDVAPTLLYLSGLPIARDFDGRVLTELLEPGLLQRQPLAFLPTYGPPSR